MGEKSSASKLNFLIIFFCFPAVHSALVSSHQQVELVDLGLLCMQVMCCFFVVFTSCSSGHSLRLQKCGTVSAHTGDRSVLHTHLELDSVSACQSNFTQQSLFTGIPPCPDTNTHAQKSSHLSCESDTTNKCCSTPHTLSHAHTNTACIFTHTQI